MAAEKHILSAIGPLRFAIMTIYGQNGVMKEAKVSEPKARLSAYLADVRRGNTVIAYDRNAPIARPVPIQEDQDDLIVIDASAPPSQLKGIRGVRPLLDQPSKLTAW